MTAIKLPSGKVLSLSGKVIVLFSTIAFRVGGTDTIAVDGSGHYVTGFDLFDTLEVQHEMDAL